MKMEALKLFLRFPHVFLNDVILLILVQNKLRDSVDVDSRVGERVDGEIRLSMRLGVVAPCVGEFSRLHRSPIRDTRAF